MTACGSSCARRNGGFTLLELLIAMSLLGLIFAALTGGLRFGTTAWQAAANRLSQTEDMQLVYRTLRRQISTAIVLPDSPISVQKEESFEGRRDQVSLIGPAPARAMAPGLYRLTLALAPDAGTQALTLQWHRLERKAANVNDRTVEPMLRGLRSIEFGYFGQTGNDGAARWASEWRETERMPRLVRISVEFADDDRTPWPVMIIPMVAPGGGR